MAVGEGELFFHCSRIEPPGKSLQNRPDLRKYICTRDIIIWIRERGASKAVLEAEHADKKELPFNHSSRVNSYWGLVAGASPGNILR